jgi:hypothetical protein
MRQESHAVVVESNKRTRIKKNMPCWLETYFTTTAYKKCFHAKKILDGIETMNNVTSTKILPTSFFCVVPTLFLFFFRFKKEFEPWRTGRLDLD